MELEQAKQEWVNAKEAVIAYFKNKGITLEYDKTTDIATATNSNGSKICECYLYDEDIIDKLLFKMPELKSKALDILLEKLDTTYLVYSKLELNELKEM